jgi:DNA-binding CsgD family transcriptional regulator
VLTERQLDCLYELALGHTTEQVAETLGITPQTVKNHLTNAYLALEVDSRVEAFVVLGWLRPKR